MQATSLPTHIGYKLNLLINSCICWIYHVITKRRSHRHSTTIAAASPHFFPPLVTKPSGYRLMQNVLMPAKKRRRTVPGCPLVLPSPAVGLQTDLRMTGLHSTGYLVRLRTVPQIFLLAPASRTAVANRQGIK